MPFLFFAALLYFLPSIIGHRRHDAARIAVFNFFLGWTVIGWIIALIWACAVERPRYVFALAGAGPVAMGGARYCSRCGAATLAGAHFCWSCGRGV